MPTYVFQTASAGTGESDGMNFEPGYLETDAPGAIFQTIRAATPRWNIPTFRKGAPKKPIDPSSWNVANSRNSRINFHETAPREQLFLTQSVGFPLNRIGTVLA